MSKFTFICEPDSEEDNEPRIVFEQEVEIWSELFPTFLNFLRGSGFIIPSDTAMHIPGVSPKLFGDRDYLIMDSELKSYSGEEQKSACYYATARNR